MIIKRENIQRVAGERGTPAGLVETTKRVRVDFVMSAERATRTNATGDLMFRRHLHDVIQ